MVKCKDVWVYFNREANRNNERHSNTEHTRCSHFEVATYDGFFTVAIMDNAGKALKIMSYNKNQVVELTCDNVVDIEEAAK